MVQAAKSQAKSSSSSASILTPDQVPSNVRSKLQKMFEGATKKGNACLITNVASAKFDSTESKLALSTEGFADFIRELTDYDAIVTPSEGALDIDLIFQKLDVKGVGHVTLKQFVDMILTTAKSASKSEKKQSKNRFNTWGRKKKRQSIDQAFGITAGEAPGVESA